MRKRWKPPAVNVDRVVVAGQWVVATGWSLGDAAWSVLVDGVAAPVAERYARPDVDSIVGSDRRPYGWLVVAPVTGGDPALTVERDGRSTALQVGAETPTTVLQEAGSRVGTILAAVAWDPAWVRHALPCLPVADDEGEGQLEWARALGTSGFAAGWGLRDDLLLIDAASGGSLEVAATYRYPRPDVTLAFPGTTSSPGWFARLPIADAGAGTEVALISLRDAGPVVIGRRAWERLPDSPVEAARHLFGVMTPLQDMAARLDAVDGVFLNARIEAAAAGHAAGDVERIDFGSPAPAPDVSVVLPVFGRYDLLHHQFRRLAQEPAGSVGGAVEVLVVVDDPAMLEVIRGEAELIWSTYGVPFTVLLSATNRGYSGANNVGAAHARGEVLVFLNSDALATEPGWALLLKAALDERPDVGLVGAVLLNVDGTTQHIGMRPVYSQHWRTWLNEQPLSGIELGSLDLPDAPYVVPSASGACVAVRADDLRAVGGFSECALIGDFEDSDLCFKLAGRGLLSAVHPRVALVHLHRQSMVLTGDDQFRQRVVLYNAWWHAGHWGGLMLEASQEHVLHA